MNTTRFTATLALLPMLLGVSCAEPEDHGDLAPETETTNVTDGTLRVRRLSTGEDIAYRAIDGRAIVDGDIDLGPVEAFEAKMDAFEAKPPTQAVLPQGNAAKQYCAVHVFWCWHWWYVNDGLWPTKTVRFAFHSSLSGRVLDQQKIRAALSDMASRVGMGLNFVYDDAVLRPPVLFWGAPVWSPPPGLVFMHSSDPHSSSAELGYQGRPQSVTLKDVPDGRIEFSTIQHEVMHSLGIQHEHQRCDRDEHVRIVTENIKPEFRFAFERHCEQARPVGSYDLFSIMHYELDHFAIVPGTTTIVPLRLGVGGWPIVLPTERPMTVGDVEVLRARLPAQ
jgi:hypothetical protein